MANECDRLRVLVLSGYLVCPPHSGGAQRMINPFRGLGKVRDIAVTYLYQVGPNDDPESVHRFFADYPWVETIGVHNRERPDMWFGPLRTRLPADVLGQMDHAYRRELERLLSTCHYDIVQVEHSQMSWVVPFVRAVAPRAKVVLDLHNVESRIFERWLPYAGDRREHIETVYHKMAAWEREVWHWYDACFTVSPEETEMFRLATDGRIPCFEFHSGGGIDLERFPWPAPEHGEMTHTAVSVGTMEWFPNAHGLAWFIDEVLPLVRAQLPDFRLLIAGRGDPMSELVRRVQHLNDVCMLGEVEDERELLWQSGVCVVPLWIAAGARVKITTAWAAGAPVVSTTLGAEGLACTSGGEVLLADDPAEFAQAVVRVLSEPGLRHSLREAGRSLVAGRYSLDRVVEVLGGAYEALTSQWTTPSLGTVQRTWSAARVQESRAVPATAADPVAKPAEGKSVSNGVSAASLAANLPHERPNLAWSEQQQTAIGDLVDVKADMIAWTLARHPDVVGLRQHRDDLVARVEDLSAQVAARDHHMQTILESPPYRAWLVLRTLLPRPVRRWLGSPV